MKLTMLKYYNSALLLIILIASNSCIDPIVLDTEQTSRQVVVDGLITTEDKEHFIELTYSSRYGTRPNDLDLNVPIVDAEVKVVDDLGNEFQFTLTQGGTGIYGSPEGFKAELERAYQLRVRVEDKLYLTDFQSVPPLVSPDSIYYEHLLDEDRLAIYISSEDPVDQKNYYMWRWEGYYLFFSNIDDSIDCCSRCYRYVNGRNIVIFDDYLSNGSYIENQLVTKIPLERPTSYLMQITQYSINEDTYDYLQNVLTQVEQRGDIFDTPPFKIKGNVYPESGDEEVLGFFIVSSAEMISNRIRRSPYYNRPSPPFLNQDCRTYPNSDTLTPINWNN